MRINHNIPALNAYRNLAGVNGMSGKSMEKLSSGLRINRAADDAAGLAISETMRGQIRGLNQASRNAQDAISLIQTAEGALTEVHSILHRMRELSNQASNATYTANDRLEIQKEVDQLKDEIDRIANTTSFNNKTLLDGSASALVSSDKLTTKVFMRGGLRTVDQFGTKTSGAGGYKLDIAATAGLSQIQKSSVFKVKSDIDIVSQLDINEASGLEHVSAAGTAYGDYRIHTSAGIAYPSGNAVIATAQHYQQNAGAATSVFGNGASDVTSNATKNMSILAEVVSSNAAGTGFKYNISFVNYDKDGNLTGASSMTYIWADMTASTTFSISGITFSFSSGSSAGITVGDKSVFTVSAQGTAANNSERIWVSADLANGASGTTLMNGWVFNAGALNDKVTTLRFYSIYEDTGEIDSGKTYSGSISLDVDTLATAASAATFTFEAGLGKVASLDTKLSDIDKFWDASGKFLLKDSQPLTLIQGDGKKTSIQLYGSDTLRDVITKLNDAISSSSGLGQSALVNAADANRFASYVTKADATGFETTEGTIIIRSAKAGADGEISVIGNEQLLQAFGMADVQTSTESTFSVNVTNAFDATDIIAQNVQIQGNVLIGVVHPNVDVKFDSNADITATWDATNKKFTLAGDATNTYSTFVHLVDNTQVFQIGANEMQDMGAAIGNMKAEALGVSNILVTDRESAGRAITIIDEAISRVSSQRSTLGAAQNRLEHTINNLGVAAENITASESRIRDVDMAQEMMEFSKLNILSQASTAMLAQANQKPQMVLQLLGG